MKNIFLASLKMILSVTFMIFLLLMAVMPVHAQKIEKINYFKNNLKLGGDVVITGLVNEVVEGRSYTGIEVTAESEGSYYLNFWLLPARLADGSFSTFDVLVNGERAGEIVPVKGNWQSIGLSDNRPVDLQEGRNTVSVIARIPQVAEIEFIRMSKEKEKAEISSEKYDSYLAKAKTGNKDDNTVIIDPPKDNEGLRLTGETEDVSFKLYTNVSTRYSFRTASYFIKGQEIVISSESEAQHVLEFFHAADTESSSWIGRSKPEPESPSKQTAVINISVPETGYYYTKARTAQNHAGHVINVNINGLLFDEIPIYYGSREIVYPADGNIYATLTITDNTEPYLCFDPVIFIEGGIEGKIVAYNDDGDWTKANVTGLRGADSYLAGRYGEPTKAFHTSTYGSYYPKANAHILARVRETEIAYALSFVSQSPASIVQPAESASDIYPNPVNRSSVLNINSGKMIEMIAVYDISGRLIQCRRTGSSTRFPLSELNIFHQGVYVLKLVGATGTITKKLVVR